MGGAHAHAAEVATMSDHDLDRALGALHGVRARMRDSIAGIARLSVEPKTPRKVQSVRPIRRGPMLVLVAEDDAATGRLYREALSEIRARVLICPTLAEARDAIEAAHFDVAVIDLVMPDGVEGTPGNGADLIPLIRARSPETRVVVSTGLGDRAARAMLLEAGVDPGSVEIVPKVPASELRAVVASR